MSDQGTQVRVDCRPCIMCGVAGTVLMPIEAYRRWKEGAYIQNAWPEGSLSEREQIISGTHGSCFDELFREDDEEPECTCSTPCCEVDVGIGIITCGSQHCPVHKSKD